MGKYVVTDGMVLKDRKAHYKGAEIELTEAQAKGLKNVTKKDVQEKLEEVDKGDADLNDLNVDDLEKVAEKEGAEVVGTGKDGKVLKKDLVKAIEDKRNQ